MDCYGKLDKAISQWENWRPVKQYSVEWICDRIAWAFKWKKITEKQMNELSGRMIYILENFEYYE